MTRFLLLFVVFLATDIDVSACHRQRRQAVPQAQACQTQGMAAMTAPGPTRTVGGGILGVPVRLIAAPARIVRAVVAPLATGGCANGTCPVR